MCCASPNRRLPCLHSKTAPKNSAMESGVLESHTAFSRPAITAMGMGNASRLSLHAVPLAYDAMSGVARHASNSVHSVILANHLSDVRAVRGEVRWGALSWVADLCAATTSWSRGATRSSDGCFAVNGQGPATCPAMSIIRHAFCGDAERCCDGCLPRCGWGTSRPLTGICGACAGAEGCAVQCGGCWLRPVLCYLRLLLVLRCWAVGLTP